MQVKQLEMAAKGEFPQVRTRELPAPGPGQVLVKVEATGVSFAEQQMPLRGAGQYIEQNLGCFLVYRIEVVQQQHRAARSGSRRRVPWHLGPI